MGNNVKKLEGKSLFDGAENENETCSEQTQPFLFVIKLSLINQTLTWFVRILPGLFYTTFFPSEKKKYEIDPKVAEIS